MKTRSIILASLLIAGLLVPLVISPAPRAQAQGCTYYMWSAHPSLYSILIGTVSGGKIYAVNGEVRVRYTGPYPLAFVYGKWSHFNNTAGTVRRQLEVWDTDNNLISDAQGRLVEYIPVPQTNTLEFSQTATTPDTYRAEFYFLEGTVTDGGFDDVGFCLASSPLPTSTPTPTATPAPGDPCPPWNRDAWAITGGGSKPGGEIYIDSTTVTAEIGQDHEVKIRYTWASPVTFANIRLEWQRTWFASIGQPQQPTLTIELRDPTSALLATTTIAPDDPLKSFEFKQETWTSPHANVKYVDVTARTRVVLNILQYVRVRNILMCRSTGETWAYPVSQKSRPAWGPDSYRLDPPLDAIDAGPIDANTQSGLAVYSAKAGDKVFAMTGGTVLDVRPITAFWWETRATTTGPSFPEYCARDHEVDTWASGRTGFNWPRDSCFAPIQDLIDAQPGRAGIARQDYVYYPGAYRVVVDIGSERLVAYIVDNPTVKPDDVVSKGCELGTTIPTYREDGSFQLFNFINALDPGQLNPAAEGIVLMLGVGSGAVPFDMRQYIAEEPNGLACGQTRLSPTCKLIANPTFSDGLAGWSPVAERQFNPSGATAKNPPGENAGLQLPGTVRQSLSLDQAVEYAIKVDYRIDTVIPNQGFSVKLGNEDATFISAQGRSQNVNNTALIAPATYTGTDGVLDLVVGSFGPDGQPPPNSQGIVVTHLCVYSPDDEAPSAGACIVLNPEFDIKSAFTQFWTPSGGAFIGGDGFADVPDGETITQNLKLFPKEGGGSQSYTLQVTFRRFGTPAGGENVSIAWEFGSHTGTLGPNATNEFKEYTANFSVVTDPETHDLVLTADGSDANQIAHIDKVCVVTTDNTPPPGYAPPPPILAGCKLCIYKPTGDLATDFTEFVGFFACFITQLWECQAKIILMGIWGAVVNILAFIGFARIWGQQVLTNIYQYTLGSFYVATSYLNGLFLNLGIQIENALVNVRFGTVVTTGGAGFWDALVAIANAISALGTSLINGLRDAFVTAIGPVVGLLQSIFNALFGIVGIVLAFLSSLINMIVLFFMSWVTTGINTIANVFGALIGGFNVSASTYAVPLCTDSGSSLFTLCLGLYAINETLLTGPVALVIPIFMGLLALELFLWAIDQYRELFGQA